MMEDKRLIRQCRRGRREALRRIHEKYHVDLLKLAVVHTTVSTKMATCPAGIPYLTSVAGDG